MKLVKAYIRPILLEDVYKKLRSSGHCCVTVFKGEGTGQYSDSNKEHGSFFFPAMHSRVVKMEIVALDENVDSIVKVIRETASTGTRGDGNIFVMDIEHAVRIRDGKVGRDVLSD